MPKFIKVKSKTVTPFPQYSFKKGYRSDFKICQTEINILTFFPSRTKKKKKKVNEPFITTEKQEHKSYPKTKIKK